MLSLLENLAYIIFVVLLIMTMLFLVRFREKVQTLLRELSSLVGPNIFRIVLLRMGGVCVGKNTFVSMGITVKKNVIIGDNVNVGKGTILGLQTTIGDNVRIEEAVSLYMVTIGKNTVVHRGTIAWGKNKVPLSIGRDCTIGYYSILDGSGGLVIGDFVHIASPAVGIWTHSSMVNSFDGVEVDSPKYMKNQILGKTTIGSNVWIGGHSTIYPDVVIKDHVIILPNSVVSEKVERNTMVGGVPARLIRRVEKSSDINR